MSASDPRSGHPIERRVLFFAYLFPPVGGGGVQRSLKFVKYLPANGWLPTVLTVRPIAYYVYDQQLLEEVPDSVQIVRTESADPLRLTGVFFGKTNQHKREGIADRPLIAEGSALVKLYRFIRRLVFFPDAQVGWIPFAVRAGIREVRRQRITAIYSPGAPYSSAVAAYLTSVLTGVPYVVDFRDGWTDDIYHAQPSAAHRKAHRWLERLVVTRASWVCVYGDWLADRLVQRYPEIANRISTIPNGFDPADLDGIVPVAKHPNLKRIVYSGSLFSHHRDAFRTVLNALKELQTRDLARVELIVVGQFYAEAPEDVAAAKLSTNVTFLGYRPHAESLTYLLSADASLLIVRKGDFGSVTGKVFELLMVAKPIIALAERDGACAKVLAAAGADGQLSPPDDVPQVSTAIKKLLAGLLAAPDPERTASFSRVGQTTSLARVLTYVADGPRRQQADESTDSIDLAPRTEFVKSEMPA